MSLPKYLASVADVDGGIWFIWCCHRDGKEMIMSVLKLSGFVFMLAGIVAGAGMMSSLDGPSIFVGIASDMRWLATVAVLATGTLLLLAAGNEQVFCRKV